MELTAEIREVENDIIIPIDFEGVHLILTGPLAWFYRLFQVMGAEEAARRELYPWLAAEKKKRADLIAVKSAQNVRTSCGE